MAQISLLCTMSIFYVYQVKPWIDPPLLPPCHPVWTITQLVDCSAAEWLISAHPYLGQSDHSDQTA